MNMRYYVIAPDGARYGPADLALLNRWIAEGRLFPHTPLIFEATGESCLAGDVPGLGFSAPPPAAPTMNPARGPYPDPFPEQPFTAYPRVATYPTDNGESDLTRAWVMFGLGLTCCSVTFVSGFLAAQSARRKGHPGAPLAMMANAVVGGITIIAFIWFMVWVLGSGLNL